MLLTGKLNTFIFLENNDDFVVIWTFINYIYKTQVLTETFQKNKDDLISKV